MKFKIRIKTISAAAAVIGVAAVLISSLTVAVAGGGLLRGVIACTVTFIGVFLVSRFIIIRFFIYKIKPLYRIITAKDVSTKKLQTDHADNDHIVEDVKDELTDWANRKSEEIAHLKDNERYRREFLGNVSHEIKTPVFTIQGYILTLLDGALEDKEINRLYLERTEKNIDRLINIINDLDDISKLESGEIVLNYSKFDVVALARDIADSLEIDAQKNNIDIKVNHSHTSPILVYADKSHIEQVLVNLITNSIKYGINGGRTDINFIDLIDNVVVEVEDNGIGIDRAEHARIFERFYRVDKSRSRAQGGTGLGLAIVKHIIEAHGEKVTMRSEPGRGTVFSFTLTKFPSR
ncbi:MAG: cell wall metabolism sensor histidine kinase WalK [Rikenellaceae bacterium]|nr:cell wall metabolism sensor histidine kinase WalK [Rikenellaceae bacterium]